MSVLKNLIDSLILVIDGYHQIKTDKTGKITIDQLKPITGKAPLDGVLLCAPEELSKKLSQLIALSIKEEPTRENFLRYLEHIVSITKPLVDKDSPLTEDEAATIRTYLTQLVVTTQHLCRLTPLQTFPIEYSHKIIHAYGLCGYFSSAQSTTGELMQKLFTAPGMGYTPEQFPESRVKSAITEIIREHQQLRVAQHELSTLKREHAQLRQQLTSIEQRKQSDTTP